MLEPESAFTKVDAARDTGIDHPLQRPVDRRAADATVFLPHQVDEIVGAEVPFLAQEDSDNLLALARALAASRLQLAEIRKSSGHSSANREGRLLRRAAGCRRRPCMTAGSKKRRSCRRILERPVVENGVIVPAKTCVLSLTFDHRVADGVPAAQLLARLSAMMMDEEFLLALS